MSKSKVEIFKTSNLKQSNGRVRDAGAPAGGTDAARLCEYFRRADSEGMTCVRRDLRPARGGDGGRWGKREREGAECSFAPTRGKRWGSRLHNLAKSGTWGFRARESDWPGFFFGMGSNAVSKLSLFCLQTCKTEVIMRMGVGCGVC
jgi:hypothetical protein